MMTPAARGVVVVRWRRVVFLFMVGWIALAPPAEAVPPDLGPTATALPAPTPLWLATQLVPSSTVRFASLRHASHGLEWQLTPLLWSFGLDRRVSPWRVFIVDPLARHGGSLELHVDPGVEFGGSAEATIATGLRLHIPLLAHGEYAALHLGVAHRRVGTTDLAAFELGTTVLFGMLGLRATWLAPSTPSGAFMLSVTFRYF
jgi:hypothetical protein